MLSPVFCKKLQNFQRFMCKKCECLLNVLVLRQETLENAVFL